MGDLQLLTKIQALTQTMLTEAQESQWERVVEIQQDRLQLIEKCFPLDESIDVAEAKTQLQAILSLEQRVTASAQAAQKELAGALGKLNQGKQMAKAYQDVSNG
ncbi:MAG: flagellar protein FliT [Chromatiales bacterium]|nr:flagellar protein FliT [Chromatiales bacterium]